MLVQMLSPEQVTQLTRAAEAPGPIAVVEAERVVHAYTAPPDTDEAAAVDESVFTWGLQAVGANISSATGKGVRLAVLDTREIEADALLGNADDDRFDERLIA